MTAVEWLINWINTNQYVISNELLETFEQAKGMEKEQIIDAHIEGQRVFDKHDYTQWTTDQAEQYYNETYKNK
jgi:hypothetical protein